MLIIMHEGNVEDFFEATFNFETFWCFNVLEIDATKSGCNVFNGVHKLIDVLGVDFDVKHIDIRENLEQKSFAFHHRLADKGANVT